MKPRTKKYWRDRFRRYRAAKPEVVARAQARTYRKHKDKILAAQKRKRARATLRAAALIAEAADPQLAAALRAFRERL